MVQAVLFRQDAGTSVELVDVPLAACRISRFNTRKTRGADEVERLAKRIARMGFERTRALWVVGDGDGGYEVFAGGTRLEAARRAGLETVPALLHAGFSDDDISRRADVDNENDEYHRPVSPVDVWAEYARLRDEEGWTQQRIAATKVEHEQTVSLRLKLHRMPERIKDWVRTGLLAEGHLQAISGVVMTSELAGWCTTDMAWEELAALVVYGQGKNGNKGVRAVRDDVSVWKAFIAYAEQVWNALPETTTAYDMAGAEPVPVEYRPRDAFVAELAARKARSLVKVKEGEAAVRRFIRDTLADYERWVKTRSMVAARAAARLEREQAILARFRHGDGVAWLSKWDSGPIRLLLTDPPYGMEYQSNRRWASARPARIIGDTPQEAAAALERMLECAVPHLAEQAHVLVFTSWHREPEVRASIAAAGLTVKGSLVWVKEDHSAGDVHGAFAPRHERIIHAVKGNPSVTPRIADVLEVARSRETGHPMEKPVDLLQQLIESTTAKGELVADPFAGTASTLVAALRAGRDFWGAEQDATFHEEGSGRLLKELEGGGEARV